MASLPLNDKHRQELNKRLQQLFEIQQKIAKAKQAQVPEVEELEARCTQCITEVKALKETYFPNKP